MVDQMTAGQIGALYSLYFSYHEALALFDHAPRIGAFTLVARDDAGNDILPGTEVSAEGIQYPPQMIAGLKDQIAARMTAIKASLAALGAPEPVWRPPATPSPPVSPAPEPEEGGPSEPPPAAPQARTRRRA